MEVLYVSLFVTLAACISVSPSSAQGKLYLGNKSVIVSYIVCHLALIVHILSVHIADVCIINSV